MSVFFYDGLNIVALDADGELEPVVSPMDQDWRNLHHEPLRNPVQHLGLLAVDVFGCLFGPYPKRRNEMFTGRLYPLWGILSSWAGQR